MWLVGRRFRRFGRVAESADARDLKSLDLNGRAGSSPASAMQGVFRLIVGTPFFYAICLVFKAQSALIRQRGGFVNSP